MLTIFCMDFCRLRLFFKVNVTDKRECNQIVKHLGSRSGTTFFSGLGPNCLQMLISCQVLSSFTLSYIMLGPSYIFSPHFQVGLFVLFVWFDSLRPIINISVIKGRVFLGWTSTKLGLMFLIKDTTQWRRWGSYPRPFGLESSTLPLSHYAPR